MQRGKMQKVFLFKLAAATVASLILAGNFRNGFLSADVRAATADSSGYESETIGPSPYDETGLDDELIDRYGGNGLGAYGDETGDQGTGSDDQTQPGQSGQTTQPGQPGQTTQPVTPPAVNPYKPVQAEPATSDLTLMQAATRLASKRWIQSFCKDDKYYYFLQMTNPYKGHLRLTRVKYTGVDRYTTAFMNLKRFGHGTNLDCSKSRGKTYLWTGGDSKKNSWNSTSITAFRFVPGKTLVGHGSIRYRIPRGKYGKKVANVYPAVNVNSNRLAVRYTYKGDQYFQIYKLIKGRKIRVHHPLKSIRVKPTAGDFQGFDITGKIIYTIEGSPSSEFLRGYDPRRKFQPTIIRTINYKTKSKTKKVIRGATLLSFREPEGVKILKGKKVLILFVSGTLTDMRANIYRVRKK